MLISSKFVVYATHVIHTPINKVVIEQCSSSRLKNIKLLFVNNVRVNGINLWKGKQNLLNEFELSGVSFFFKSLIIHEPRTKISNVDDVCKLEEEITKTRPNFT